MKSSFTISIFKIAIFLKLVSADCEHGVYYSHPMSCGAYLVCVHGQLIEMWCPPTLWYNNELSVCDYPERVICSVDMDTTTDKSTTLTKPTTTTTKPTTTTTKPTTTTTKPTTTTTKPTTTTTKPTTTTTKPTTTTTKPTTTTTKPTKTTKPTTTTTKPITTTKPQPPYTLPPYKPICEMTYYPKQSRRLRARLCIVQNTGK